MSVIDKIQLMPINYNEENAVRHALSFLPRIYPNGGEWLEAVISENRSSTEADILNICTTNSPFPMGYLISKQKGIRQKKISTFWIKPQFRRLSIGQNALSAYLRQCFENGIDAVTITHNPEAISNFEVFLRPFGFATIARQIGRYHPDETEVISSCRSQDYITRVRGLGGIFPVLRKL